MMRSRMSCWFVTLLGLLATPSLPAQGLEKPRAQDRPPGPPLSPEEAVAKMTVPEGFSVEIVAAEPDVVNPVAMFIDEKGRFWITESLEYPRREPGPGKDRVKVLEDTDGDGKVDKVTVFADGLNIPSGIAVGYGGVWVANSPDILFMQDTDGDGKADKTEVVVTGFGRTDTHELPNSFTWGPDGWLYGLNGVFNHSHVRYAETNPNYKTDHPGWKFTCAMWRIHPRTREFQVFAEGTSNPWGIAINDEGDFFCSACVIDHLWHIVETGYYIRQGGPYPPHTWPIESIVEHKHQKAAYCGITWFDSDAYPEEYRKVLYMGNIHGNCINADVIERNGSTYKGKPHPGFAAKPGAWDHDEFNVIRKVEASDPASRGRKSPDDSTTTQKLADLLTANDAWFMPVVQKTGPDGCLYILDWYDRYHCYQDANADPAGIERAKGRLYRLRYKDTPHAQPFDLAKKTDEELIGLMVDPPNTYFHETASRLLAERGNRSSLVGRLKTILGDVQRSITTRRSCLWVLGAMNAADNEATFKCFSADDPTLMRWALHFALRRVHEEIEASEVFDHFPYFDNPEKTKTLPSQVLLQLAIDLPKMVVAVEAGEEEENPEYGIVSQIMLTQVAPQDRLIPRICWNRASELIQLSPSYFLRVLGELERRPGGDARNLTDFLGRAIEPLLASPDTTPQQVFDFVSFVAKTDGISRTTLATCLTHIGEQLQTRALRKPLAEGIGSMLSEVLSELQDNSDDDVRRSAIRLSALLGNDEAKERVRQAFLDASNDRVVRLASVKTLIAANDPLVLRSVDEILLDRTAAKSLRTDIISALGSVPQPEVADILLKHFDSFEPDVKPKAIEVLCQRAVTAVPLLAAIDAGKIDKAQLNLNQVRQVAAIDDATLKALIAKVYGAVRDADRSDRRHVIANIKEVVKKTKADPVRGEAVFKKLCGQCHKLYGEGADVGPDITRNGRNNWDQLLQNIFDPSLVIGPGYQARIIITTEGRVLTGLPVEESEQRVVLKIQGGKTETIPRDQIDLYKLSEVSLMPEDLEKQLQPQEIADLLSFLALDKHPKEADAKLLPGYGK